jgi:hypothetical protein
MSDQIRTCGGICKKFQVTKPSGYGRYESGQAHCQICNTWIDHNGCKLKDGSNAVKNSVGWFCKCCNVRVRQKPRNKIYKEKLRNSKNYTIQESDFSKTSNYRDVQSKETSTLDNLDYSELRKALEVNPTWNIITNKFSRSK